MRLARAIARAGLASRREAERWIVDGRVEVEGEIVRHPGTVVEPDADIRVDGKPLPPPPRRVILLLYKPKGTITTRDDPQGRKTVFDLVDIPERVEPVGRLDYNTEGALLLTNDGDLAHALTHPSAKVPKRYLAKVWRTPDERTLERLRRGVKLEDGRTAPARVRVVQQTDNGNAWVELTVTEGRNLLIRRMMQAVNHPVSKLRRESFATISIRGMERGEIRELTAEEVARLEDIANGVPPRKAGHEFRYKKGYARPKPRPNKPLSRKKAASRKRNRK
ncbi:MAG: rRNA pseudouridine synthase [Deltaproteobacteria bacterium]|nr:MAG: rRNA pseudouridine synthase [Deltaproteobacteria bacterium]